MRYELAADDRVVEMHLLAISGISVAKGCLGHAAGCGAGAAPPQSSLVHKHHADTRLAASRAAMQAAKPPPMISTSQSMIFRTRS